MGLFLGLERADHTLDRTIFSSLPPWFLPIILHKFVYAIVLSSLMKINFDKLNLRLSPIASSIYLCLFNRGENGRRN